MTSDFSAIPSNLGYFYQFRIALLLLLKGKQEAKISIESLDDILLNNPKYDELVQVKHHMKKESLTDKNVDLWKTLKIWITHINNGVLDLETTCFTLITTSLANEGTAASLLRPFDRNRDEKNAIKKLKIAATNSTNKELVEAFELFKGLEDDTLTKLFASINIIDGFLNIVNIKSEILNILKYSSSHEFIDLLYTRLEGWWINQIIDYFNNVSKDFITQSELQNKIVELVYQFSPESLPIDFLYEYPDDPPNPDKDTRIFVEQLKVISIDNKRIEKAIVDFYRAFAQRSKWISEDLIMFDKDIKNYENRLVDEWERHFLAINDKYEGNIDEKKIGKEIYYWMEMDADIRIKPKVDEPYVMRGSYHILANNNPPNVYWHPTFLNHLRKILS